LARSGSYRSTAISYLWAAIHGAVVLQLAGKLTPGFDFDRILQESMRALIEGFRPGRPG
jgi:hypothetical protein